MSGFGRRSVGKRLEHGNLIEEQEKLFDIHFSDFYFWFG